MYFDLQYKHMGMRKEWCAWYFPVSDVFVMWQIRISRVGHMMCMYKKLFSNIASNGDCSTDKMNERKPTAVWTAVTGAKKRLGLFFDDGLRTYMNKRALSKLETYHGPSLLSARIYVATTVNREIFVLKIILFCGRNFRVIIFVERNPLPRTVTLIMRMHFKFRVCNFRS